MLWCWTSGAPTLSSAGTCPARSTPLAILNGGYNAWLDLGVQPATGEAEPAPSDITLTWTDRWMIDSDGVRQVVNGESEAVLLDARPLDFFQGKKRHNAAQ